MLNLELNEAQKAPYPEMVLLEIFQMALDYAENGAKIENLKPNHFIVNINSKVLDYDIFTHLKQINHTSAEQILNRFELNDQSNRQKERDSVISAPFQLDILAIETKTTRKRKFPGASLYKRQRPIDFEVNDNALYKQENEDNFCLFRAFAILLARERLPKQRFSDYLRDDCMILNDVYDIMNEIGVPYHHVYYDITVYGQLMQQYLNNHYPGKFKIFCFNNSVKAKPIFKADTMCYEKPFVFFYWEEDTHYEAVRCIRALFDSKSRFKYCFAVKKSFFS